MRRREFIAGLGGAAAAWPLAVLGQQAPMPVVGFLNSRAPGSDPHFLAAFHQGLREAGFVEGRNVAIEYRWAEGQNNRLPELATDLVRREVTVIATGGVPGARSAKAATTTIPIAFVMATDPVEVGLVTSLNRPGGNLTGVTSMGAELAPKRLELLQALVPTATVAALLINPSNPILSESQSRDVRAAARTLGVQLHVLNAGTDSDINSAFATLSQVRAQALVIATDGFLLSRSDALAKLAVRHAMPTVFQNREFAAAGGLMSYGANSVEAWRQLGVHTGRLLRGEKPADLPIQQATKIELIINLKTAKALGLSVPLLGRADEVIE